MRDNLKDTIAAISTPIGEGGIGIVRLSGNKALSIADNIFIPKSGRKPSGFKTYTVHYGHAVRSSDKSKKIIDEVILTIMRAPKTYTKEDVVEINCHGGIVALKEVMEEVVRLGARAAEPGEFTKRAFLNGRIDLAQAEAVCDVIKAKTEMALKVALTQLEGDFSKITESERENLLDVLKDIEAQIDFSEEDIEISSVQEMISRIEKSYEEINKMLDTEDMGMLLKEGITCVICGKPNVGKSSLLNTLLRRNRAIVTHIPGTTRDIIEEIITVKGIAVKLVDTAGITKSKDLVEKEGIERTKAYIKKADMIILMLDMSTTFGKKDADIMRNISIEKTLIIANKSDLRHKLNIEKVKKLARKDIISMSVLKKENINILENKIAETIWAGKVMHPEPAFLTNIRHKKALASSLKSLKSSLAALRKNLPFELVAIDVRESVFQLGLITGESVDPNILDRIFDRFCIGK